MAYKQCCFSQRAGPVLYRCVPLRVQVVFGSLGGCQLVERDATRLQNLAERAQYKVGTLAVSGGGGLSYAAFLRPEATHNAF